MRFLAIEVTLIFTVYCDVETQSDRALVVGDFSEFERASRMAMIDPAFFSARSMHQLSAPLGNVKDHTKTKHYMYYTFVVSSLFLSAGYPIDTRFDIVNCGQRYPMHRGRESYPFRHGWQTHQKSACYECIYTIYSVRPSRSMGN